MPHLDNILMLIIKEQHAPIFHAEGSPQVGEVCGVLHHCKLMHVSEGAPCLCHCQQQQVASDAQCAKCRHSSLRPIPQVFAPLTFWAEV